MKLEYLLDAIKDEPMLETNLLFAGAEQPQQAQRQVTDWTRTGKLVQLRRGLYALAKPHKQARLHPFVIANRLLPASYVSLQMALAYYSLIPEHVAVITSVTTQRPGHWDTPYGSFAFKHIQTNFFYGFTYHAVSQTQAAFVALPEKALLDLVYLQPGGDSPEFLASLRLQNLDQLNLECLLELAQSLGKPKLQRAAQVITQLAMAEAAAYRTF